ncbi:GNAT family N-acetyltransferase [Microbacterium testaceum]|uniref:GNAT family N-acetyltransferase n=1 Tax=Microbacterium testaceum TaxID=2033 RepID=UPI00342FE7F5
MTLLVRLAQPAEYGRLVTIWRAAVLATHDFLTREEVDEYEVEVERYLPSMTAVWVASEEGRLLGFVAAAGSAIEMLFVDPERHGEGVGRTLVEHVSDRMPLVTVDVNEENVNGRRFYSALGFVEVGRSDLDDEGKPHPILHLERRPGRQMVGP